MTDFSAAGSALLLVATCLSLSALLVWVCHDAERPPPPSYVRSLLTRTRLWKF